MPQVAAAASAWWALYGSSVITALQWVSVAASVYGGIQQRSKAKRAAQQQRDQYNASLTDRTVNLLGADNPLPIVYGETTVGATFAALLTSGAKDEFKHLIAVWAAHECEAILDFQINGESIGALDVNGYVQPGSRWYRTGTSTVTERVAVASGGVVTVAEPIHTLVALAYQEDRGEGDGGAPPVVIPVDPASCSFVGNVITLPEPFATDWVGTFVHVTYLSLNDTAMVRVRHHLGQPGQVADADLIATLPGEWSSTDRGDGLCWSWVELNLLEPEFQSGPPQVTVTLRGKKLYDPRLDSTQPGGSGPQRFDNPATHTWSANNALATADFLSAQYGKRARKEHVIWPSVMASANACDTPATYGSTTQALYTCHGAFSTAQDPDATLEALCQSMAGFATLNGGWYLQAGAYTAPVMVLTDADNAGPVELAPVPGLMDVANGVRGRFYDPTRFWQLTDYTPYQNSGFISADGGEAWESLDLPFTDSALRCHQLARVLVERGRGTSLVFPAKLRALRLKPGQRVTLTVSKLGITSEVFRVVKREYGDGGPVRLALVRDDPSFYDLVDAPAPLALPIATQTDPFRVQAVANLVATTGAGVLEVDPGGRVFGRVLLTFDASPDVLVQARGALQVEYRRHDDPPDDWNRHPEEPGSSVQCKLYNLRENTLYIVRARWRNAVGVVSDWRTVAVLTDASFTPTLTRYTEAVAGPVSYSTLS